MARATDVEVSQELDGALTPSEIHDRWLERAHRLVNDRAPDSASSADLDDAEVLVAAHIAYPHVTGSTSGEDVRRVSEGDATLAYDTTAVGPDGVESPYWAQAVNFYPWLDDAQQDAFFQTF